MQTLKKLTDEALLLKPKFERLSFAIFRTLDNHGYKNTDRTQMHKVIMQEITRRRAQSKAQTVREVKQMDPTSTKTPTTQQEAPSSKVTSQMLRDARAHELRQPPSAYDPDHPENSP